ncbi:MFS transporter [Bacillus tianshenii]|nr:MFS transporter [Bacillus tianshenii]
MTHQVNEKIWTRSFVNIFVSNFFVFSVFYALLTTLPIYVTDELGGTDSQAGLVVTVFLLSAIIVRPFSGRLLERFGKKRMLLISLVFFAVATVLYMPLSGFYALLGLRFFHGIWFSILTTATGAIAADLIPMAKRGEGLGYFAMSMNIAVVAGPFFALTLLQFLSFTLLFLVLSVVMAVGIIATTFVKTTEHHGKVEKRKLSFDDLFERRALPIALVGSFTALAYSSVISFISIYAKSLGLIEAAGYFFVVFAGVMLVSRPFTGRLFDRMGGGYVIYPCLVIFAGGLIALSMTDSAWMLLLSAALIGIGYGNLVPSFQTLAVSSASPHRCGHATATFFTFFDTGIATGSYVLGMLAGMFGYSKLYMLATFFVLVSMTLYKLTQRKPKKEMSYNAGI